MTLKSAVKQDFEGQQMWILKMTKDKNSIIFSQDRKKSENS